LDGTEMNKNDAIKIDIMTRGGKIISQIMKEVIDAVAFGVTTAQLNDLSNEICRKYRVRPAFLGFNGYPASICASINNIVVHGIPNNTPLQEGDLVGLDFGIIYNGFCLDCARTKYIGTPDKEISRLIKGTRESLGAGSGSIIPNVTKVGDIGFAIEGVAKKYNLGVVRDLAGHGIGRKLQEEPSIPNFGEKGLGRLIKPGMTIAIEPMLTLGTHEVGVGKDGWSVATKDGSLSAHFEDTFAILEEKVINLTK